MSKRGIIIYSLVAMLYGLLNSYNNIVRFANKDIDLSLYPYTALYFTFLVLGFCNFLKTVGNYKLDSAINFFNFLLGLSLISTALTDYIVHKQSLGIGIINILASFIISLIILSSGYNKKIASKENDKPEQQEKP